MFYFCTLVDVSCIFVYTYSKKKSFWINFCLQVLTVFILKHVYVIICVSFKSNKEWPFPCTLTFRMSNKEWPFPCALTFRMSNKECHFPCALTFRMSNKEWPFPCALTFRMSNKECHFLCALTFRMSNKECHFLCALTFRMSCIWVCWKKKTHVTTYIHTRNDIYTHT